MFSSLPLVSFHSVLLHLLPLSWWFHSHFFVVIQRRRCARFRREKMLQVQPLLLTLFKFPELCSLLASYLSFWYLRKSCLFCTSSKASSDFFSSSSFISSKIWSRYLVVALLCSISLSSIGLLNISSLSLNTCTSCLVFRHLLSNSTRPVSCAFHLARLAIHNTSSPCLKISKICWPFSFIACWATCRMEILTFPIFLTVLAIQWCPLWHHHCLLGISAFSWPSSRKRYSAFACLPSRPNGLLPPWTKANFSAATTFFRVLSGHGGAVAITPWCSKKCHSFCPLSLLCTVFPWLSNHLSSVCHFRENSSIISCTWRCFGLVSRCSVIVACVFLTCVWNLSVVFLCLVCMCGRKFVQQVVRDVLGHNMCFIQNGWVNFFSQENIWTCACADRDLESVCSCVWGCGREEGGEGAGRERGQILQFHKNG